MVFLLPDFGVPFASSKSFYEICVEFGVIGCLYESMRIAAQLRTPELKRND